MMCPPLVATAIMELSGLQHTSRLVPSSDTDWGDLLWEMIGTLGLAYQMRMLSCVRIATKIRSLLAATLMGSVPLSCGRDSMRGQPTGKYILAQERIHKRSKLLIYLQNKTQLITFNMNIL